MGAGFSSDSSYEPSRPFEEISTEEFERHWVKYVKYQSELGWNQMDLACPDLGKKWSTLDYLKTIRRIPHLTEFLLKKGKIIESEVDANPDNLICFDKPKITKKLLYSYLVENPPRKEKDVLPMAFKISIESHWNRIIRKRHQNRKAL